MFAKLVSVFEKIAVCLVSHVNETCINQFVSCDEDFEPRRAYLIFLFLFLFQDTLNADLNFDVQKKRQVLLCFSFWILTSVHFFSKKGTALSVEKNVKLNVSLFCFCFRTFARPVNLANSRRRKSSKFFYLTFSRISTFSRTSRSGCTMLQVL